MADTVDHSAEPGLPDPDTAHTPAEFVAVLRGLQGWTGEGLRQLEKRAKANGDVLPRSTVAAALGRPTLPREDLVVALVSACGCDQEEVARWVAARRRIAAATASSPAGLPPSQPADPARQPANPTGQSVNLAGKRATRPVLVLAAVAAVLAVAAIAVWGWGVDQVAEDDPLVGANVGPPTTLPPMRDQPCNDGWICLYEHADFNRHQDGRKLQFREDYWQWLGEHDFDDKMSSWKNHLGREVCLSQQWPVVTTTLPLPAGTAVISMEPGWDEAASGLKPGPCGPN
ncbi:MAG: peptidase inhibitor family I36 protein [Pseudonocardiales bacterium]